MDRRISFAAIATIAIMIVGLFLLAGFAVRYENLAKALPKTGVAAKPNIKASTIAIAYDDAKAEQRLETLAGDHESLADRHPGAPEPKQRMASREP